MHEVWHTLGKTLQIYHTFTKDSTPLKQQVWHTLGGFFHKKFQQVSGFFSFITTIHLCYKSKRI